MSSSVEGAAGAAAKEALQLLLTRYSMSAKHLGPPGPSAEELWLMGMAALRAPDRNKKMAFRFVVAQGEGLERLARLFEDYARRRGKQGDAVASEREKAMQAPVAIAVVARIDEHDDEVPAHEQWACVGAAIGNAVMALHFVAGTPRGPAKPRDEVDAACILGEF